MSVICIIPARGGSKGIPGKNIIEFCGKPLLAWSIIQAENAQVIDQVYVSSDDDDILRVAEEFGAIAVRRPENISTDTSTSEEALSHVLDEIKDEPDLVVFLQATSPLRTSEDIGGCVKQLLEEKLDSLFSMVVLDDFTVWSNECGELKGLTFDSFNRERRQARPNFFLENGSIYVLKPSVLKKYNNRVGDKIGMFKMDYWKCFEIDKPEDIEICSYYFKKFLQE